jgi:hypothetical protein
MLHPEQTHFTQKHDEADLRSNIQRLLSSNYGEPRTEAAGSSPFVAAIQPARFQSFHKTLMWPSHWVARLRAL